MAINMQVYLDNGLNVQVLMSMLKVVVSTYLGQPNLIELIHQTVSGVQQLVKGLADTVKGHNSDKLIHRDITLEAIVYAVEVRNYNSMIGKGSKA